MVTEGCNAVCKRCSGCKVVAVGLGCCSLCSGGRRCGDVVYFGDQTNETSRAPTMDCIAFKRTRRTRRTRNKTLLIPEESEDDTDAD